LSTLIFSEQLRCDPLRDLLFMSSVESQQL